MDPVLLHFNVSLKLLGFILKRQFFKLHFSSGARLKLSGSGFLSDTIAEDVSRWFEQRSSTTSSLLPFEPRSCCNPFGWRGPGVSRGTDYETPGHVFTATVPVKMTHYAVRTCGGRRVCSCTVSTEPEVEMPQRWVSKQVALGLQLS